MIFWETVLSLENKWVTKFSFPLNVTLETVDWENLEKMR